MKPWLIREHTVSQFPKLRKFFQHCVTFKSLSLPLILPLHGFVSSPRFWNDWTERHPSLSAPHCCLKDFLTVHYFSRKLAQNIIFSLFLQEIKYFSYFMTASTLLWLLFYWFSSVLSYFSRIEVCLRLFSASFIYLCDNYVWFGGFVPRLMRFVYSIFFWFFTIWGDFSVN